MATKKMNEIQRFTRKLEEILHIPESTELFNYIWSIEQEKELREYLHGLLGGPDSKHGKFINQFISAWRQARFDGNGVPVAVVGTPRNVPAATEVYHAYRKSDQLKDEVRNTKKTKGKKSASPKSEPLIDSKTHSSNLTESKSPAGAQSKQKVHYSPLYSTEGQNKLVVRFPGRRRCECQATKHKLINNCVNCGRIVCSQEGSGPCHNCSHMVVSNEEQEILDKNSQASKELLKKLTGQKPELVPETESHSKSNSDSLEKALRHKDRLLEFDRTVERRTKVIDDQSDYFTSDNRWLSKEEREAVEKREKDVQERRKNARKTTQMTFDFAGRQVIEEKENFDQDLLDEEEFNRMMASRNAKETSDVGYELNYAHMTKPKYDPTGLNLPRSNVSVTDSSNKKSRLQGNELQEMSDEGQCLSLHQPFATLLVTGLKIHEGRSWYTSFRGRLWIASTARELIPQEVYEIENTIRALNQEKQIEFPSSYPVGALLGCVNVVDCLPQEEYRERYPDGESTSPYVFICEQPNALIVKFPIKGKHKIYKLDANIHKAAKKALRTRTPTN